MATLRKTSRGSLAILLSDDLYIYCFTVCVCLREGKTLPYGIFFCVYARRLGGGIVCLRTTDGRPYDFYADARRLCGDMRLFVAI